MKNTPEGKHTEFVEEVRNCLTIILWNAELILENENLTEQGREEIKKIERTVWRINQLPFLKLEARKEKNENEESNTY